MLHSVLDTICPIAQVCNQVLDCMMVVLNFQRGCLSVSGNIVGLMYMGTDHFILGGEVKTTSQRLGGKLRC